CRRNGGGRERQRAAADRTAVQVQGPRRHLEAVPGRDRDRAPRGIREARRSARLVDREIPAHKVDRAAVRVRSTRASEGQRTVQRQRALVVELEGKSPQHKGSDCRLDGGAGGNRECGGTAAGAAGQTQAGGGSTEALR